MFQQVHVLWRRLSPLLHCSDGCVGDTCRRICQSCPSGRHSCATLSSSSCRTPFPHADKSVHTPGHTPTWLLLRQRRACPLSWSPAPSSRVWLQRMCLLPRGNTQSAGGLHLPCTRSQTEVGAPLRRFSTVLDVGTVCTMVDSGNVSDCAARFDQEECRDL